VALRGVILLLVHSLRCPASLLSRDSFALLLIIYVSDAVVLTIIKAIMDNTIATSRRLLKCE